MSIEWFEKLQPGDEVAIVPADYRTVVMDTVQRRTKGWVVLASGRKFRYSTYGGSDIVEMCDLPYPKRCRMVPGDVGKTMLQSDEREQRDNLAQRLQQINWNSLSLQQLTQVKSIVGLE